MSSDLSKYPPEELWGYYMEKYRNKNPIATRLVEGFFKTIEHIVGSLDSRDRLLEVGCGPGESSLRIMEMLSGQHFEVSEYEEQLVVMLQQMNFPLNITQESVYSLKREDNEFDGIFLLEVLEHLEDYRCALKEVFRVSRKHVIITVPNEPLWRTLNFLRGKYFKSLGNTPGHINHWNRRSLVKLISEFGVCKRIYTPIPWIVVHAEVRR
jgi:ubiquinone/menaquinone biosynthesis C-methylase UbiE